MSGINQVSHELSPIYDKNSKVLILGTIPSPKSRKLGFYYMHPQNRFWKILCRVLEEPFCEEISVRESLCRAHGIALWDVLSQCEIEGAADASIKNAQPNDLGRILSSAEIKAVFLTGKKAFSLYQRFFGSLAQPAFCLPSTSPANRTVTEEEIFSAYLKIREFL